GAAPPGRPAGRAGSRGGRACRRRGGRRRRTAAWGGGRCGLSQSWGLLLVVVVLQRFAGAQTSRNQVEWLCIRRTLSLVMRPMESLTTTLQTDSTKVNETFRPVRRLSRLVQSLSSAVTQ